MSDILVTGAAGFIGHAVCLRLAESGVSPVAVDSFDPYYDPKLKQDRADRLRQAGININLLDVADADSLLSLARQHGVTRIIHLAAQAGVRHSIEAPFAYQHANLKGHLSVLECCRHLSNFQHLVYASSSSVYGNRPENGRRFSEDDRVDRPASLYAASKRSGELISESYASLYGIPQSGLRFFTVYGPWGRPDMAYFSFTKRIFEGKPIEIFGMGKMRRDFTFIDDIVDGIIGVLSSAPTPGTNRLLNIGNDRPEQLLQFVSILEGAIGREAIKIFLPMQAGDVIETWADLSKISELIQYKPKTKLIDGLPKFVDWYRHRYEL